MRVLKFGSSVLRTVEDLPLAVHRIYRELRQGRKVVAVVSALGDTTDRLVGQARALDLEASAELLATGEQRSVALLQLALERAGVSCTGARPSFLRVTGPSLDARPCVLDASLHLALREHDVVVVPGFVGQDPDGRICTLGRGGSDLSALFIAAELGCECTLVKDVDGLYERDPREGPALRYAECSWEDALRLDGGVVQHKAVAFARERRLGFQVGETRVGARTRLGPSPHPQRQRVALFGLGTVGRGVWQRLHAQPDRFEVVGVAVRNTRDRGVPVTDDLWGLLAKDCEVVVELIGGLHPAYELVRTALESGKDVVTANKRLMAAHPELRAIAQAHGARLLFSASVGGAVCALEAAGREEVLRIEAVINGTCNFVLDRLAEGEDLDRAVRLAQDAGYAEADPRLDLDGSDAADKLLLLAHGAWGLRPQLRQQGITELDPAQVREARLRGEVIRLVATATPEGATVCPRLLPPGHPLADTRGAENRVLLTTPDRTVQLRGLGAGRWPTTEAVVGDLWELACVR